MKDDDTSLKVSDARGMIGFCMFICLMIGVIIGAITQNRAYETDIQKGYLQWTGKYEQDQIHTLEEKLRAAKRK